MKPLRLMLLPLLLLACSLTTSSSLPKDMPVQVSNITHLATATPDPISNSHTMPDALRRQLRQVDGLLAQVGERQVEASKLCAGIRQRVLIVDVRKVEQLYVVSLTRSEK